MNENIIRVGTVNSVDSVNRTARVAFHDKPGVDGRPLISAPLAILNYSLWIPEIGQTVLCVYLPQGEGDGIMIGGL
jgi:phage baseplate assembly protein gpV